MTITATPEQIPMIVAEAESAAHAAADWAGVGQCHGTPARALSRPALKRPGHATRLRLAGLGHRQGSGQGAGTVQH